MLNKRAVQKQIIRSLISTSTWGGKHTELRNLKKGLPTILTSTKKGQKLINKAIKDLINKQFLLIKPSTGELHASLNTKMKKEIMELLK